MGKFDFRPKGVMPAMVTPFNKDESINEEQLRNLVNHFIDQEWIIIYRSKKLTLL